MKKTITTFFIVLCILVANAQIANKGGGIMKANSASKPGSVILQTNKAIGDTLLYSDGYYWYPNAADFTGFTVQMDDMDQLPTNNANYFMSFGSFYDTTMRVDWWMPWDVDTAWYFAATSWFNPAGQADNWLQFGPITLPAGAELSWFQRYNGSGGTAPFWFDGYEVLVSTTGISNYSNFLDPAIFTRADYTGTDGTDSSWAMKTVVIPSMYANTPCYFAFHHNANDMDVLYLDEIKIVESAAGVDENANGFAFVNNAPNPADQSTVIKYQLNKTGNVLLQVMDVTGRIINQVDLGTQSTGVYTHTLNTSELTAGIYFYVLDVNKHKSVNKLVIER
ncbi:MAG: T9SS type A sorting domain-containing protein [Bacteroidota bacterium]